MQSTNGGSGHISDDLLKKIDPNIRSVYSLRSEMIQLYMQVSPKLFAPFVVLIA